MTWWSRKCLLNRFRRRFLLFTWRIGMWRLARGRVSFWDMLVLRNLRWITTFWVTPKGRNKCLFQKQTSKSSGKSRLKLSQSLEMLSNWLNAFLLYIQVVKDKLNRKSSGSSFFQKVRKSGISSGVRATKENSTRIKGCCSRSLRSFQESKLSFRLKSRRNSRNFVLKSLDVFVGSTISQGLSSRKWSRTLISTWRMTSTNWQNIPYPC